MQTFKTSKSKENILARIRKELNKKSLDMPFPEAEKQQNEDVYTPTKSSIEETFADKFISLGGKFVFCNDHTELLNSFYHLYENRSWKKVLCADANLLESINSAGQNIALAADEHYEDAEVCITNCEALVARTGSAIISSNQYMGRTSTVFYPTHIIVAYSDQVVNDISDAIHQMKKKYGDNLPSMINLSTGPSRTADIEKTLVVGVHGPREVFCFFVNSI